MEETHILFKMGRIYDRELECGCLISSDGGGGLISCCAEQGDMRKKEDKKALQLHDKCWGEWKRSKDYKRFLKEMKENNP